MKLLTNKQFQGEIEKNTKPLKREIEDLNRTISNKTFEFLSEKEKFEKKIGSLKEENESMKNIISEREQEIVSITKRLEVMTEKYKKAFGAKGGLTKQLNKIEKELEEANDKLSKRYIVKELKSQKPRNTQVMKIKDNSVTSKIIKKVTDEG